MRRINWTNNSHAFTFIEALIILAVLMLFATIMLPRIAKNHGRPSHVSCVNSLKQVGLGYAIWAGDHNDKFPMEVSTNQGGSMELALAGDAVSSFLIMSNELSTPKILICPTDRNRTYAANFSSTFNRSNISYFVGVDAVQTNVTMFLSGDRNITNGTRLRGGLLELTTNRLTGWTAELHENAGNIGLADGSVKQVSTMGLLTALENSGVATNRLAVP